MQSLILVVFIILICGLLFLVVKWPQGKHATFSRHAAAYKHTIVYYNLLFTIVLPMLVYFFITWFVPTFHLSFYFSIFITVSSILQYFVTVIPEVGGWKTKVHRPLAFLSGIFLLPPMLFILFSNTVSLIGRATALFSLIVMIGIICIVAVRGKRQKYLLFLQIGYFASFFITILIATYL